MRERAEEIGARLRVDSVLGAGTVVEVMWTGRQHQRTTLPIPEASADMRSQRPIRVLLVDDHEIVRRGLAVFLDGFDDMELVGQAEDGEEALERCHELSPDVVLMDLVMPKMDGPTAIRKLQAQNPEVKVVALTTFRDKELCTRRCRPGQSAICTRMPQWMNWRTPSAAHLQGIQCCCRRRRQRRCWTCIEEQRPARVDAWGIDPHARAQVLALLVEGLTNRQIAHRLHVSESTAKQYVRGILSKLQVSSRTEAVAMAVQQKLLEDA